MRRPHNQWHESALLRLLEKKGAIIKKTGATVEFPLDINVNAGGDWLETPTTATSTTETAVLGAASYAWAERVEPINTSMRQEAISAGDPAKQKVNFIKSLIQNAINSHDEAVEVQMFNSAAVDGMESLATLMPSTGQPSVGGIDGSSATYFRNNVDTYLADGTDLEAVLTDLFNACAKGTGSNLVPTILVSDGDTQALYEGGLQPQQRFETSTANGGFKVLKFKDADYCFSQSGSSIVYMFNAKSINLVVAPNAFRSLKEEVRFSNAAAYNRMVYSLMALCTNNPSRTGAASVA